MNTSKNYMYIQVNTVIADKTSIYLMFKLLYKQKTNSVSDSNYGQLVIFIIESNSAY